MSDLIARLRDKAMRELYDPDKGMHTGHIDWLAADRIEAQEKRIVRLEAQTSDLSMLVKRLVHELRKVAPQNELSEKTIDYLKHNRLVNVMRAAPKAQVSELQRYGIYVDHACGELSTEVEEDGDWVRYEDYTTAEERVKELERQLAATQAQLPQWIHVTERLPERKSDVYGEMEFYCKTACGIEVQEYYDYDGNGSVPPSIRNFGDLSTTEWLSIPGVTKDKGVND